MSAAAPRELQSDEAPCCPNATRRQDTDYQAPPAGTPHRDNRRRTHPSRTVPAKRRGRRLISRCIVLRASGAQQRQPPLRAAVRACGAARRSQARVAIPSPVSRYLAMPADVAEGGKQHLNRHGASSATAPLPAGAASAPYGYTRRETLPLERGLNTNVRLVRAAHGPATPPAGRPVNQGYTPANTRVAGQCLLRRGRNLLANHC